ncbi:unnamed protein product [Lota lota]
MSLLVQVTATLEKLGLCLLREQYDRKTRTGILRASISLSHRNNDDDDDDNQTVHLAPLKPGKRKFMGHMTARSHHLWPPNRHPNPRRATGAPGRPLRELSEGPNPRRATGAPGRPLPQ